MQNYLSRVKWQKLHYLVRSELSWTKQYECVRDNSSASAGRQAQTVFIGCSLQLNVSRVVSASPYHEAWQF